MRKCDPVTHRSGRLAIDQADLCPAFAVTLIVFSNTEGSLASISVAHLHAGFQFWEIHTVNLHTITAKELI